MIMIWWANPSGILFIMSKKRQGPCGKDSARLKNKVSDGVVDPQDLSFHGLGTK